MSIDRTDDDKDFLYLFLNAVDGYIDENDKIKYLLLIPNEKNKGALKNYKKLWEETKRQIKVITGDKTIEYRKGFMKIRFELDDGLHLSKAFNIP